MALPVNIDELINGKTVEWERMEFRRGWNPARTVQTICAFANDFNNWGGGYVVVGVAEEKGQPALPPAGLQIGQIDSIQKEVNTLCRKIIPNYFPIVEPVDFQGRKILILWCPGGSIRPYKAPESLEKNSRYFYFIRHFSSTVKPSRDEERELIAMANQVPFDDRVNHRFSTSDLDLSEIKVFLNEVKSDLENEIPKLHLHDIARRMNIVEGADEYLLPKNVGLLFFGKNPQQPFPSAKIEVVLFKDDAGTSYDEKIFEGPIHYQLKEALKYIKNMVIEEKIIKRPGKPESDRFFNYPYQALEEALANAVYHRGYDNDSTIEVRIYSDKIDIISFPGPLPPLDKEKLKNLQFTVRKYRNRRIGEFLKDLHLTEGRSTGIPTIIKELERNQSPPPEFETDEGRTYFKTTIFSHNVFRFSGESVQVSVQVSEQANFFIIRNLDEILTACSHGGEQVRVQVREQVKRAVPVKKITSLLGILELCMTPQKSQKILEYLKITKHPKNYKSNIVPLIENTLIELTIPDKPTSRLQKYRTTEKGKKLLEIIK